MAAEFTCRMPAPGSRERVFDLARDVDLHVRTMARSRERAVAGVTSGLLGPGDEVTWVARHGGVPWRMTVRVTAFDRPHRFVDEQVSGPFHRFRHEHTFEEEPDGRVVVHDHVRFTAPLGPLGRAVEPLLRWYLRRLVCQRSRALVAPGE
jgi:hypothetical protein